MFHGHQNTLSTTTLPPRESRERPFLGKHFQYAGGVRSESEEEEEIVRLELMPALQSNQHAPQIPEDDKLSLSLEISFHPDEPTKYII